MIKIDLEEFVAAFEHQGDEIHYLLNTTTGEIVMEFDIDFNPGPHLIPIDSVEPCESFKIMEKFTGAISDGNVREIFESILSRKHPFRNFKDKLTKYPSLREKWFKFHMKEMEKLAKKWLLLYKISCDWK